MNKTTILIVEDEAIVAEDLAAKLRQLGYEVAGIAAKGEEAVALADSLRPDLVLMDIQLEGSTDGIEAAESIRSQHDLPIIYLTAHSDAATLARAKLSGPFGFILKPFEERELATNIEMALYKHQADRQLREQRDQLAERTVELQAANETLRASRTAALNLMDDAIAAREKAEKLSLELQREIDERKRADKALRESEERFRAVFESSSDCILVWDSQYNYLYANQASIDYVGTTRDKVIGKNIRDGLGHIPDFMQLWMGRVDRAFATGESFRVEDVVPVGDRLVYSESQIFPIRDAAGRVFAVGVVYRDVTERKRAEEALRESETRLARAQEIAHLGSWELDLLKNELTWSDEVYRIFGLQPQEFGATYEAFIERVHPEDRTGVDAAYQTSVREGRDFYEIEHRVVRNGTGEIRWVHEKCQHIRDSSGTIIRSVGMVHDITERKRWEEELGKLTEELQRSNSDLEQFAYIASHDLQSPLRNVEGFTQLLARRYKGKLDEKADEFIHCISTGVKDMQMLILDILEYSKVGSGGSAHSEIDISLCVSKAISNLKDAIAEKHAGITYDEKLPIVSGDPAQLTSLFQNLIGNAIKFCTDTPKIHLSVKKERGEYVFSVRDNGIGINPLDSDKIFAVFHRLHNKTEYPGTGIGLAICKKIVDRHGGRIWVESEPGKGSTFFFSLPAKE